ncbi:hypothetical protein GDO81_019821 [Engystomops pustulosus]|uniref:Copper homeostasis protein cutC homolog n=1 Tax=Engystomops pustulosus TaxID=76066 RepID=A0AAV6ZKB6_ENGPU|nr:hypothetical protein GDO81_019821 [Engystomops pustulosus]
MLGCYWLPLLYSLFLLAGKGCQFTQSITEIADLPHIARRNYNPQHFPPTHNTDLIKRLVEQAKGRIIVMPGGGITERNLHRILEGAGVQEFHCSARSTKESLMKYRNNSVTMGAALTTSEYSIKVADVTKVRTLNAMAKNFL